MSRKRRQTPLAAVLGPLETEVMEAVWDGGEVTVRDVQRVLTKQRPVAYTTVMTTMGRLADKGFLRRIEVQPAHRYSALLSRDQYAQTTVSSILDWLVGQFGDPAVAYFVDRLEKEDAALLNTLREAIESRKRADA
jgi:BlaI family transcriptional regulator, penicillinase repressor